MRSLFAYNYLLITSREAACRAQVGCGQAWVMIWSRGVDRKAELGFQRYV